MLRWPWKGRFMNRYVTQEHFDRTMSDFRAEFNAKFVMKDEFNTRLDEVITILKRLDQERVFTIEWIRRIDADMGIVKKHLKLA
jgi:hypothetical protein